MRFLDLFLSRCGLCGPCSLLPCTRHRNLHLPSNKSRKNPLLLPESAHTPVDSQQHPNLFLERLSQSIFACVGGVRSSHPHPHFAVCNLTSELGLVNTANFR